MIDKRIVVEQGELSTKVSNVRKIVNVAVSVIVIPLIIINLFMVAQIIITPDKIPNFLGYKCLIVTSGSMLPTIEVNDLIIVKEIDKSELTKGDIITFNVDGIVITHRIYEINRNDGKLEYTTKGDHNNAKDTDIIKEEQIEGRYVMKLSILGNIVSYVQTTQGLIMVLAIPCVGIVIGYKIHEARITKQIARKKKRIEHNQKREE